MKNMFMNNMVSFISKYKSYNKEDLENLKYGLEGLYLSITKLFIVILFATLLHIFKEVLIVIVLFNLIRYFGFGFHAEKSSECLITSLCLFIVIPYVILTFDIPKIYLIVLSLLSIFSFVFFAPADTRKRPLKNKKKRLYRKIATITMGIIYLFLGFVIKDLTFSKLLFIPIIIQAIVINPLIYKIMGQPYNNYKSC